MYINCIDLAKGKSCTAADGKSGTAVAGGTLDITPDLAYILIFLVKRNGLITRSMKGTDRADPGCTWDNPGNRYTRLTGILSACRLCLVFLIIACLVSLPRILQAQTPETTSIGTVSGQIDSVGSFEPFTDYLESSIPGRRFEIVRFSTIEELVEAVNNKSLDFAFITPAAYVEVNLENEYRTLLTITQMAGDTPSPWLASAVFTLASRTDITNLEDVRDKKVVALSELALGGWLAANREWKDLSIDTANDAASVDFVFSYSALVDAVCTGAADIGVIAAGTFDTYSGSCTNDMKVLPPPGDYDPRYSLPHSTRLYPEVAFAVVREQDEEFIRQLTLALLAIENGSEPARAVNIAGFTAPLVYSDVRSLMQVLRLGPFGQLGQLTITEALQENAYKITFILSFLVILITVGFIRAQTLSHRFRQSEIYRKRVFEGSNIAMVVMDPVTGRFLDLNPAAVRLLGYGNKDDVTGLALDEVSAAEQEIDLPLQPAIRFYINKAVADGEAVFEWKYCRPDGSLWDARVHLMSFASTKGELIQATLADITEQKRLDRERRGLERQLEQSQRMESIGRLAGGIAHDFNNLLMVINGYCEVLQANFKEDTREGKTLSEIRKAGLRASDLTSQLLTFSRNQISKPIPLDLDEIIIDTQEMFQSVLGEDIRLELNLKEEPGLIFLDPGQLHQVLLNMIVNAKDAMPDGGSLKVATENRTLGGTTARALDLEPGDYVVLKFSDTGCGMDENVMNHIFEPFFSTKGESGTGLGLSSVYGIVRQTRGGIRVESERGKGSVFTLYFPVSQDEDWEVPEETQESTIIGESLNILVVEDQEEVKEYTTSVLRDAGYKVFSATSGSEALSIAEDRIDGPIHLLLTDVVMEGMNGKEVADVFREKYPDTRILFMSGYAGDELAKRGVLREAIQFLEKPYSARVLLAKVGEVLKNCQAEIN